MIIKGIDHIAVNVRDMQKSIEFYGLVMGLLRMADVRMEDHRLVYFKAGTVRLELIQYDYETMNNKTDITNQGQYRHLALQTDNIDEFFCKAKKNSIKILQPVRWNERLQFWNMLVLDPNGCEIEIIQRKENAIL